MQINKKSNKMQSELDDEYDICKRLKGMFKLEMSMTARGTKLAKDSSRFHENLASTTIEIARQQHEYEKIHAVLTQRRQDIDQRMEYVEALRQKLNATKQRNAALGTELSASLRSNREQLGCMHTLKEATNTYINQKALPAHVQGVIVLRGDGASRTDQWVPFKFAAHDASGLDRLWHNNNINASEWRQLIGVAKQVAACDSENVENAPPVIDLT